ncbi:MAG: single-stranded DNA-binding protein [Enterobacteriaceae bacterium]|nr:single-stranded DNA-binding protein [Enterobacteriaceae bacterium]
MINKVILIGNLGSDPEIVNLSNNKIYIRIKIVTVSFWKNIKTQELDKRIEWHQIVLYNNIIFIKKYLKKGSQVYVEGFLKTDVFKKNDNLIFFTKIICNNIILLSNENKKKSFFLLKRPINKILL